MNITKAITGLMSVAALTLVTAGASMAAVNIPFSFSAVFLPNPIPSNGGLGNVITVANGFNPAQLTPTAIQLANFQEISNTAPPNMVHVSTPFTDAVTITTAAGSITKTFAGSISGDFNTNQTFTNVVFSAPGSQDYVFAGLGTLTVSNLQFDQPGSQNSGTVGSLSAQVIGSTPTTTPEPATVVPFALGGLALLGLIVRKTRQTGGAAA